MMKCLVCDCTLESAIPSEIDEGGQPSKGTAFQSHGHYGSTVFDPMDGTFLEIYICDPCLTRASKSRKVMMGFPRPATPCGPLVVWKGE